MVFHTGGGRISFGFGGEGEVISEGGGSRGGAHYVIVKAVTPHYALRSYIVYYKQT